MNARVYIEEDDNVQERMFLKIKFKASDTLTHLLAFN